jgi:hydrogenase maturation protein HypF
MPVVGVSLDGTGYGPDGCIWGGEFLLADYREFERVRHLEYVPMPGGVAAIEKPYRMAAGYLFSLFGGDALVNALPLPGLSDQEAAVIQKQIERGINSPLTSSCGRLFDAVSALLGLRGRIEYEAQAAIDLEMVADESVGGCYPFRIENYDGTNIVKLRDTFEVIIRDLKNSVPVPTISARFHRTIATVVTQMCKKIAGKYGIKTVALSGGVFQNRLLLRLAYEGLTEAGFRVLLHELVPANDGGISLGQAVIAHFNATE